MQFNALCGLLVSLNEHQETEFRKQMYYNVLEAVKKRWAEITEPRVLFYPINFRKFAKIMRQLISVKK